MRNLQEAGRIPANSPRSSLVPLVVRKVPGVFTPTDAGGPSDDRASLPLEWRSDLDARLEAGESLLAWFSPDLDTRLHFCEGLVVVTDRRLLHGAPAASTSIANGRPGPRQWHSWPLRPDLRLRAHDRSGIGTLDLVDSNGRLAVWRYTISRGAAVGQLIDRFDEFARSGRVQAAGTQAAVCPSCGADLAAEGAVCEVCLPSTTP